METILPEDTQLSTKDIILRYGLIGGGVSILVTTILYIIDFSLLFGGFVYIGVVSIIIIGILAALHKKRVNSGFITYGETVAVSIGSFSVSQALATVFGILLYLVIDPSLVVKMKNVQMDKMDKLLSSGTFNKEQYKAATASIEKIDSNSVLFYSLGGFLVFAILVLIIYLITSIFIKNESPFKNNSI
jgi:hypothetical protein